MSDRHEAEPVYIAMWSGPRNISTAMMRAFENRPDAIVWDEPFYAAYLRETGLDHPMREEILAHHETDAEKIVEALLAPLPAGRTVFYQKHMTHHMLPAFDRDWIAEVTSVFLIRSPEAVLASYTQKRAEVTLADIGVVEQWEIFDQEAQRTGRAPPVIEADDVLADPPGMLAALCRAVAIPMSERMLAWPPGRRASDGIWAAHWYGAVERSTGFARPEARPQPVLAAGLARIAEAARPHYERLHAVRLGAS